MDVILLKITKSTKTMKKTIILSLAVLIAIFAITHGGQTKIKSYYSGDAINFKNRLYVLSTNSGSLEIFRLSGDNLVSLANIKPFDPKFNKYGEYYDALFSAENNSLYVYAISGFSLYKYELTSDDRLTLIASQQNNYWEWYNRVDKIGDKIATISERGVKIWNTDIMDVIDSLPLTNTTSPYNIRSYNNGYVLNSAGNNLEIYSLDTRTHHSSIPVNFKKEAGNRKSYQDEDLNLYIVDDYYTKKFDLNGRLLNSFRHLDYDGYDVSASGHSDFIYFSNGLGVVKLKKNDLSLVSSQVTTGLGGPRGWAMGMKVVYMGGDKIVLFNNSNILVMDADFKKLASHLATEEAEAGAEENLYLNLDHLVGAPGASITINGGGFYPQENLIIDFAGHKINTVTDNRGRFSNSLTVPNLKKSRVDIKVSGETSNLHYSIAFEVR